MSKIITINRMLGSNGRMIGKALADKLGINFYDRELLEIASREKNISFDILEKVDEKKANQWRFPIDHELQLDRDFHFIPMNDVLYDLQRKIILNLSEKEDCVIVGRCANHILAGKALRVFIYAPVDFRTDTLMERTGLERREAERMLKKADKERRTYYEYFTDKKWNDPSQYNLCIDSSRFSQETIVDMLAGLF